MAKKKQGRSQKRRSERKIQDAFHLAERAENASGSDGEFASDDAELHVRDGIMDARRFVNTQGDGGDDEFSDEDLDSDEALGSDDDFDVLNSKFSQTIRDKRKRDKGRNARKDSSANDSDSFSEGGDGDDDSEDEDGYESIDESQLVTLSEAWDMDDRDREAAAGKAPKEVVLDDDMVSVSDSDSESDLGHGSESGSEDESRSEAGSDESKDESEDEEAMLRGSDEDAEVDVSSTVSRIQSSLKPGSRHKRLVAETMDENEFGIPTGGQKLALADMMAGIEASTAPLVDHQDEDQAKPLAVPLPKRIQQRHDRKAAYEITKQDVSRWEESVRAIRDADHLSFPLAPPAVEEQEEIDAEEEYDALRFIPEAGGDEKSELEKKTENLLRASALLDESNEATFEQMAAAKLSKEDMLKRTQELRRMRELMFRDEQRAKRIKKIKSKQFRKIRKKSRLRDAELVEGSDAESDPEDHDMRRAEERMSLRHKTQSKWAKTMIKSGITKDASSRAELEEMLRAGERLRSKQLGYREGEQSDDNISDIEREYAADEANALADDAEREKLGKGVLAMDFMKAAEEKRRKENRRELEQLRDTNGLEEFQNSESNSINQLKNQGRRVYSPAVAAAKDEMDEVDEDTLRDYRDDDAKSLTNRLRERKGDDHDEGTDVEGPPAKKHRIEEQEFLGFEDNNNDDDDDDDDDDIGDDKDDNNTKSHRLNSSNGAGNGNNTESESDAGDNPWLAVDEGIHSTKSTKFTTIDENSSKMAKAAHRISKHSSKRGSKESGKSSEVLIDSGKVLHIVSKSHSIDSDDNESDGEPRGQMFRQQNLIQEAFAGDDVVSEFLAEKKAVAEEEGDKEEDLTLPGWGGWGGAGTKTKQRKRFVRKVDGVVQKDHRRDKDKHNVIINESVNKHNLKYQSSKVPFPYESKEQYERALRMPVGEEWSSRATHQKSILPRIMVKQGVVVDPMKAPFK